MSEDRSLDQYIESICKKRQRLEDLKNTFQGAAQEEPDQFKRVTGKTFARCMEIMEDLFMNLEMLAIVNSGLRNQNEVLKDIVIQLQEVKANERMQLNIDKAFSEHSEWFKKQYDDFLRRQGKDDHS